MKATQDKDFDRFFADGLGDMEQMPSEKVWAGISKKQRRTQRSYRSLAVAASVLVLLSAGLWIYRFGPQKTEHHLVQKAPVKKAPAVAADEWHRQALAQQAKDRQQPVAKVTPHKSGAYFVAKKTVRTKKAPLAGVEETEFKASFTPQKSEPLPLPQVEQPASLASAEAIPAADLNTPVIEEKIPVKTIAKTAEPGRNRKHAVQSIGDLVNLVVAKVDKREDKIIEFTDEDGESNVSGINLGFINIKKGK